MEIKPEFFKMNDCVDWLRKHKSRLITVIDLAKTQGLPLGFDPVDLAQALEGITLKRPCSLCGAKLQPCRCQPGQRDILEDWDDDSMPMG